MSRAEHDTVDQGALAGASRQSVSRPDQHSETLEKLSGQRVIRSSTFPQPGNVGAIKGG
jgi:hypothetical protein